jgi:hypothetical protein
MKTYSQEQLIQLLTEWMVKYRGSPMELDDEVRDQWYRDNGLIAHFIRDHFPSP